MGCTCSSSAPSRNLVVCIDGTSNQFGPHVRFWFLTRRAFANSVGHRIQTLLSCIASSCSQSINSLITIVGSVRMPNRPGGHGATQNRSCTTRSILLLHGEFTHVHSSCLEASDSPSFQEPRKDCDGCIPLAFGKLSGK